MGLVEQAKLDWQRISSNSNEWGVEISLVAPDETTVTVKGLHGKHHLGIDENGRPVNSRNAHFSISEKLLTDASYPVRDSNNEVNLKGHKAIIKDSTGSNCSYMIREWLPDETIGVIVCILGEFE